MTLREHGSSPRNFSSTWWIESFAWYPVGSLLRRPFDAKRTRSIVTDPREAGVGSILGWARRGRSQPPSVLAAVVDASLVGDNDEINVGKVRAFAQRARSDLEIDGIAAGAVDQMVAVGNARLEAG